MKFTILNKDFEEINEFYDLSDIDSIREVFDPEIHQLIGEDASLDFAPEFDLLCEILEQGIEDKVFAALEVWPTAYNLETALYAFDKHYVDYFEDEEEFARAILEGTYPEIPGFLVVDWQTTGERLKQDYLEYDGYYFRK